MPLMVTCKLFAVYRSIL